MIQDIVSFFKNSARELLGISGFIFFILLVACGIHATDPADIVTPDDVRHAVQVDISKAELAQETRAAETLVEIRDLLKASQEPKRKPKAEPDAGPAPYCPRLIVFTAVDWCLPCQALDAEIKKLETSEINGVQVWCGLIGQTSESAIQVVDVSGDDAPGHALKDSYRVNSFPTIIKIDRKGREESRFTGVLTASQLSDYQCSKWNPPRSPSAIAEVRQ